MFGLIVGKVTRAFCTVATQANKWVTLNPGNKINPNQAHIKDQIFENDEWIQKD